MRRFLSISLLGITALLLSSCGQKTIPPRVYEMGHRVPVGNLIYTVFETQWLTQVGSGATAHVPQNRFFLIRLSIVNSGPDQTTVPTATVIDDAGNSIEETDPGDGVPNGLGLLRQVKPAESIDGNIAFDAPPKHYKLKVTDENGDKAAFVDIPLNFTSESPEIAVPSRPDQTAPPVLSPGKKK